MSRVDPREPRQLVGCWTRRQFDDRLHNIADTDAVSYLFFFQAEDGIRDLIVTGVQTCALPISLEKGKSKPDRQSAKRVPPPRDGWYNAPSEFERKGRGFGKRGN